MKCVARTNFQCKPNVITYSALMTACCSQGQPDKALDLFVEMQSEGIVPDQIAYAGLIAGVALPLVEYVVMTFDAPSSW